MLLGHGEQLTSEASPRPAPHAPVARTGERRGSGRMTIPHPLFLLVSILLVVALLAFSITGETRYYRYSGGVRIIALGAALVVAYVCVVAQGWAV